VLRSAYMPGTRKMIASLHINVETTLGRDGMDGNGSSFLLQTVNF